MLRLTRSQVQPIGIDLGLDSVKMLQLEVVGDSLSVAAAARHEMPPELRSQPELRLPVAMDAIRSLLRSGGFAGRHVVAALPREIVHVKNIRLPMMPPVEVAAAVQFEARNIFPFDTEQSQVHYLPAGEVRQGGDTRLEVIALAAKNADVNGFVEQLHRCGCIVESLDFEPAAVYRGIERFIRRREDESEVNVLAEIGARRTQVIIGKGRDITFCKAVDIGSMHLQDAVERKLQITTDEARTLRRRMIESGEAGGESGGNPDSVRQAVQDAIRSTVEELAKEIQLCLRYYSVTFRGQRPGRLRLLGGESCDPQLLALLGAALPVTVEACRPLASVNTSNMKQADRRGCMGEWAVAFGLGLRKTSGHFGAKDGQRRDPSAAATPTQRESARPGVEVIDLGHPADAAMGAVRKQNVPEAANA